MTAHPIFLDGKNYDLFARLLLAILFPFSALDKVIHYQSALAQADSSFLPGGPLLLAAAILIETGCPLLILMRRFDAPAAALLAAFCLVTALLYHPFWAYPGLFDPVGGPAWDQLWDFLKNLAIVGGLMFVVRDGRWLR